MLFNDIKNTIKQSEIPQRNCTRG